MGRPNQISEQPILPTNFNSQTTPSNGLLYKHSPEWIFDCGATDTMIKNPCDLLSLEPKTRTHIQIANGECVELVQTGPIYISPSLHLKICLLIPILSHKLLYISL